MCSIAGSQNEEEVRRMLKIQKHRAPDQDGLFISEEFTLGAGRLAIVDIDNKTLCPYEEDGYVLSYNGEIYNYLELRKELELRGWKFTTNSDTEVVLKAYRQWGEKCLNKFNGMFAIAIKTPFNKIFLARDIAGEKPLYYRHTPFAFASEAKALRGKIIDSSFFEGFQHCFGGTLYEGVREVLPAHYLTYDMETHKIEERKWWSFSPRYINPSTALDELDDLLKDAVKIRTASEVPYALYFSGGVDSTLISDYHDFRKFKYNTSDKDQKDFDKNIRKIVHHLDFPVGSFSSYPLWALGCEAKKKGIKVVISGEGADEVFGGYIRYLPVAREYELARRYPSYAELFNKVYPSPLSDIYAHISKRSNNPIVFDRVEPFFKEYDPITAMQLFDFTYILPSLLQMGDRMAGAHGIENRCPFLDKRIIEFGLSLPPELKIKGVTTKVLLRELLARKGLKEVETEKKGLIIPWNKWAGVEGYDRSAYFSYLKELWMDIQV